MNIHNMLRHDKPKALPHGSDKTIIMNTLEQKLAKLKTSFVQNSVRRVTEMHVSTEILRNEPGDFEALETLYRHFHAFSGLGSTYGYPLLTKLGRAGEETLHDSFQGRRITDTSLIVACEALVDAVSQSVASEVCRAQPQSRPEPVEERRAAQRFSIAVLTEDTKFGFSISGAMKSDHVSVLVTTAANWLEASTQAHLFVIDGESVGPDRGALLAGIKKMKAAVIAAGTFSTLLERVEWMRAGVDSCFSKLDEGEALLKRIRDERDRVAEPPRKILSIEDDPDQAEYITAVLESAGYEVRVCATLAEIDPQLRFFQPDLLLMDINLGDEITGHDVARTIRQQSRYATLPIIFMTTEVETNARMETFAAGGDDHLVKPVAQNVLISAVAARMERAQMLRHVLEHDPLTGLLTHSAFFERAKKTMAVSELSDRPAAIVMIDLDSFKTVNDQYGHAVGDRVLMSLAATLRRGLRGSDHVGRYGGEEFAVVLDGASAEDAMRRIDSVRLDFSRQQQLSTENEPFTVTFSAGVAMLGESMRDPANWLNRADKALYAAKRAGRNRVVLAEAGEGD